VDGFKQQPEIANGVSDLMVELFGEAGRHARFAVGTNALPRNCATESDATEGETTLMPWVGYGASILVMGAKKW